MKETQQKGVITKKKPYVKPSISKLFSEEVNTGFLVFNEERIETVNPYLEKITGYQKEELLKMSFLDLFHPNFKEMILNKISEMITEEKTMTCFEAIAIKKTGQDYWVKVHSTLIINNNKRYVIAKMMRMKTNEHH